MGVKLRYTGRKAKVLVPGEDEPRLLARGDIVEVRMSHEVRLIDEDPDQPFERVRGEKP